MTGFMKTTLSTFGWLEAQAVKHQRCADSAYRIAELTQRKLGGTSTARRRLLIEDLVRAQHAAAYHATSARECLLAALRLKGGQEQ